LEENKNKKQVIHANGKLLLSAEYFVLDGAMALALPTQKGQTFTFENIPNSNLISWKSFDDKNQNWFDAQFNIENLDALKTNDTNVSDRLTQIFLAAQKLNPDFLKNGNGFEINSHLTFPRNWGLGTSSTLIYSVAKWAAVDPFKLLENTFGGSGYDIACAGANKNILYSKMNGQPEWSTCNFNPSFKDQLYFVFLGKKQNSREGIAHYRKIEKEEKLIFEITALTQSLTMCHTLSDFEKLLNEHEHIISKTLHLQKVKDLYFKDYWGSVKSLGAWGGDFVLVTSNRSEVETQRYFKEKGFEVFLKYKNLILDADLL